MASRKEVLGRGLHAILTSDQDPGKAGSQPAIPSRPAGRSAEIDMARIRPNPYQPRQNFLEETLHELADSIRRLGIIQPVTVRATPDGFELISGERRLRAARLAGLTRIPAYVREADSERILQMAIVENIQRDDLNPLEVALAYRRLIEECDLTQEQVAERVAKSRTSITNALRLLRLPTRIQAGLRDGAVSVGHARALINIEDERTQLRIFDEIETKNLSVRDVEERVRRWRASLEKKTGDSGAAGSAESLLPDRDALQLDAYATHLRNHLGTQVRIRHRDARGRIEIEYYSNDDLERVVELIVEG